MRVLGVMPIKHQIAESNDPADRTPLRTTRLITRMLTQAQAPLHIVVVADDDPLGVKAIEAQLKGWQGHVSLIDSTERNGYWKSVSMGAQSKPDYTHVLNLANDLMAGREWLSRAIHAYQVTWGDEPAILGMYDAVHPGTHAGHFIADKRLLREWYGEDLYPFKYYKHLYADNEIVERAHALRRYGMAIFSCLFHDHPVSGGNSDAVYKLGHESIKHDSQTYEHRKQLWKR